MSDQPLQYQLIGSDGIEYGPVSADDVRTWIREGRASAKTMVRATGSPAWRKLGELPEFAEAIAQRAANAPAVTGSVAAPKPEQNKTARMGFILSVVSLLCCCVLLAPAGLIVSIIALVRINSGKDLKEGYGFAVAGIVISLLVIILNILVFNFLPKFMEGAGSKPVFSP
ncbi:MAG: domain containing protein [Verrucomicrobia bacterium]|jgi:predicted hotdog family 3-hydroxylacyl-ACP dehydratase|nr:domain containing protein [Verrucomicrobiota bacterium]